MPEIILNLGASAVGKIPLTSARDMEIVRCIPSSITISNREDAGRDQVERFIEQTYWRIYGAGIAQHYPVLIDAKDHLGNILAAIGVRYANGSRLFVENYLDDPIEKILSLHAGQSLDRTHIAEIGNLASSGDGATAYLYGILAACLHRCGVSHATVTATRTVRRCLRQIGCAFTEVAAANPDRLPDGGLSWGSYYRNDPKVLIGAVVPAAQRLGLSLPQVGLLDGPQ